MVNLIVVFIKGDNLFGVILVVFFDYNFINKLLLNVFFDVML